jgi:hypothetical protein
MKVIELVQRLQEFDPEMVVVLRAYEGGYNTVSGIVDPQTFVEGVNRAWYYGPHELDDQYLSSIHADKPRFQALTIY